MDAADRSAPGWGVYGGDVKVTKPLAEYELYRWMSVQYREAVGLAGSEGGARYQRVIDGYPTVPPDDPRVAFCGRTRMSRFLDLKLGWPLSGQGYVAAAVSARFKGHSRTVVAYFYWPRGDTAGMPEYVALGHTYDSRDGEYRSLFTNWEAFEFFERALAGLLEGVERAVLDAVGERRLKIDVDRFPSTDQASGPDLGRLAVRALAVVVLREAVNRSYGVALPPHVSAPYRQFAADVAKAFAETFQSVAAETASAAAADAIYNAIHALFAGIAGTADDGAMQCGQKLVPMFVKETERPNDVGLAAWRELELNELATELVLNFCSPSFSIYNQWTFVEGATADLFENPPMRDRYRRGETAVAAVADVRAARRHLRSAETLPEAELAAKLYDGIEYAQSFLELSDVAMVHTLEDVGPTFTQLAEHEPVANPRDVQSLGFIGLLQAGRHTLERHLFEAALAAHCLHGNGVAHTDAHAANMTYYRWHGSLIIDNSVVAYAIGDAGEADTYMFPAAGDCLCLIDFSRAIIGPGYAARLERRISRHEVDNFYRDQGGRVLRALHRYAPRFVEQHETQLRAAVISSFDSVFAALCAVDFVAIGRNLSETFDAQLSRLRAAAAAATEASTPPPWLTAAGIEALAAGIALGRELERAGLELFLGRLTAIAAAVDGAGPMPPLTPPGLEIIPKVWAAWRFPAWAAARADSGAPAATLVDAYMNKPLRWSGREPSEYPPWARLENLAAHLGKEFSSPDELFARGTAPFLAALRSGARFGAVAEQARAESARRDGKASASSSPWIAD